MGFITTIGSFAMGFLLSMYFAGSKKNNNGFLAACKKVSFFVDGRGSDRHPLKKVKKNNSHKKTKKKNEVYGNLGDL